MKYFVLAALLCAVVAGAVAFGYVMGQSGDEEGEFVTSTTATALLPDADTPVKAMEDESETETVTPLSEREATARSVGYSWETPMSVTVAQ